MSMSTKEGILTLTTRVSGFMSSLLRSLVVIFFALKVSSLSSSQSSSASFYRIK